MSEFTNKIVLAIGAHPDDIEFGCGGTMAKLAAEGAVVFFVVATDGNRGSRQHVFEKTELVANRQQEAKAASQILGAQDIMYLEEEDGNLVADIAFKEKVVRVVRKIKPDMIFTHDPNWFYKIRDDGKASVNHSDHRACGIAVLDAVYPLARDLQSFPEHSQEGLEPHITPELYLFNFDRPDFLVDISQYIDTKVASIAAHKSQIDNPEETGDWMKNLHRTLGQAENMEYAESFVRLVFA